MKTRVIGMVTFLMGVSCTSSLALAQNEEETSIEFAPDDEPIGSLQTPPPPNSPDKKEQGDTTGIRRPSGNEWGPPAPPRDKNAKDVTAVNREGSAPKSGSKVFGRYRIRVGAANPTFSDQLKFYKDLYGSPSVYPVFGADWFAWDWYVTFGLSLKTGYYTADGKAVKPVNRKSDISSENLEKDQTSSTTLTLVPTQIALAAQFTPFPGKWLVVDGWYGVERLYFQEVRTGAQAKTTQKFLSPMAVGTYDEALTNNGWKSSRTSGVALNILLNPIDEQSIQSMRGSMGLASIYLSPYVEIVRQFSEGVNFSRVNRGITFTFETSY